MACLALLNLNWTIPFYLYVSKIIYNRKTDTYKER